MKIRNVKDLAQYVCANDDTEASISRRVYKDTDCGAWVELTTVKRTRTVPEVWRIKTFRRDDGVAFAARRRNRGPWLKDDAIRGYVSDYLLCDKGRSGWQYGPDTFTDWQDFCRAIKSSPECKVLHGEGVEVGLFLDFDLTLDGTRALPERSAVRVGSIVEGVDECAETQTLVFPFTSKQWDAAVQAVEDDCKRIWDETHGCDDCGEEDEWTGHRAINPNCKTCGGEGTIL